MKHHADLDQLEVAEEEAERHLRDIADQFREIQVGVVCGCWWRCVYV